MSEKLSVSEAIDQRFSARAFLDEPVSEAVVSTLLDKARGAPSGGNLQPWRVHVLMGDKLAAFKQKMQEITKTQPISSMPEYNVYPEPVPEPYNTRRRQIGAQMYDLMGVDRKDKQARTEAMMKNFTFFEAPVGMFISLDRCFDRNQWGHVGMFAQSLCLLAVEAGLGTCMQEAWVMHHEHVAKAIDLPESQILWMGLALGYPDYEAPVNTLKSERAPIDDFVKFIK
ncbi:MAG: nitroreductase [Parvibaculales bacterium]